MAEGVSNTPGGWKKGTGTQRAGLLQAEGRAGETGLSENIGFRRSTETTSFLEPRVLEME